MKRFAWYFLAATFVWLSAGACNHGIKYKDDLAFRVSAQANSPEFPIYVNGTLCRDSQGYLGACTTRVKSTDPVVLKFGAQAYGYSLHLYCSKGTGVDKNFDVEPGAPFEFKIEPGQFSDFLSFTCIGEVFPADRDQPVSGRFDLRMIVVDGQYVSRETPHLVKYDKKTYLVLGEHSRSASVYDCEKEKCGWKAYKKTTVVRVRDLKRLVAYSESHNMRFNYFQGEP